MLLLSFATQTMNPVRTKWLGLAALGLSLLTLLAVGILSYNDWREFRKSSDTIAAIRRVVQLNDDLLGIWGDHEATGKVPTDVARHKMTLPVIYAFEHAGPVERGGLEAVWRVDKPDSAQVAEAVAMIERLGGRDYTRDQAHSYRDKALAELEAAGVVDAQALESLRAIIMSAIKA